MIFFFAVMVVTALCIMINPVFGITVLILCAVASAIVAVSHLRQANKFIEDERQKTLDNLRKLN